MKILISLMIIFLTLGCWTDDTDEPVKECTPADFKCSGDVIKYCNSEGMWESDDNCSDYDMVCTKDCGYGDIACCE